jgi:hypothetical protein
MDVVALTGRLFGASGMASSSTVTGAGSSLGADDFDLLEGLGVAVDPSQQGQALNVAVLLRFPPRFIWKT